MPQNRTGSICAPELLLNSTPLATFTHMHSKTNEVSNGMDSSRSTPPTKLEVKSSMASAILSGSTLGVLLPVCLLAVFLSCVAWRRMPIVLGRFTYSSKKCIGMS